MATSSAVREPLGARFAHLVTFSGLSNLADGLILVGLPLLALTLTRSPLLVSLVSASFTLPWLLLSLHVGVLVDRADRVRLVLLATLARVVALGVAAVLATTGRLTMPVLLALVLVFGIAEVVADSASSVLVPAVVPRSRLGAANSRMLGVQQLANSFLGAPLAGVVLSLGAGWLFGVPAALCGLAALVLVRGLRGRVHVVRPDRPDASIGGDLREGLRFLVRHPVIRPLLVTSSMLNFCSSAYFAVLVLWVVGPGSFLGLTPRSYGFLASVLAVGALLGAVLAEPLLRRVGEARLIAVSWFLNTALLLVPALVRDLRVVVAALALVGFSNMVGNVVSQTMRQRLVPERLLGRVGGASRMLGYGCMPVGAALGGVVGQMFGLPAVLVAAPVVSVAFVAWAAWQVPQRVIDQADALAVDAAPVPQVEVRTETDADANADAASVSG